MTINKFCLACITTASLAACSSVFYHPTDFEYADPARLRPIPEDVSFRSEDGVELHGWYFHADKPKGRIIQFHGNAQNLSAHFMFLRHATVAGYDHFIFDYRGYGRSRGSPAPLKMVADGRAALRWLAARDGPPIVVLGQSLGGAIALRALTDLKGEVPVRVLALDSTFLNYRSAARGVLEQSWITWPFQPLGWAVVSNAAAPGDLSQIKVGRSIVVHGDADRTVPIRLGRRVYEALPEPKAWWPIASGRHTDFLWRIEYEKKFFAALDAGP